MKTGIITISAFCSTSHSCNRHLKEMITFTFLLLSLKDEVESEAANDVKGISGAVRVKREKV